MMKRFLLCLCLLIAGTWGMTASAGKSYYIGGELPGTYGKWTFNSYSGELFIDADYVPDYTSQCYNKHNVIFPENDNPFNLVQFYLTDAPWSKYVDKITKISISPQVKKIGKNAFSGLYKVTEVKFAYRDPEYYSQTIELGTQAFRYCWNLRQMDFGYIGKIGIRAFERSGLEFVVLPSVTEIGDGAFDYCKNLMRDHGNNTYYIKPSIIITNTSVCPTITSEIARYISYDSQMTLIVVPPQFTNIYKEISNLAYGGFRDAWDTYADGDRWWYKQDDRLVIADANSVWMNSAPWSTFLNEVREIYMYHAISIGKEAFKNFTKLETFHFDPYSSQITVGDNAFDGCTSLCNFTGMDGVEYVGASAFNNCSKLYDVNLTHCRDIGDNAFYNTKIYTLRFGSSISKIGDKAFCYGLQQGGHIYITAANPPTVKTEYTFSGINGSSITLHVPADYASAYNKSPWTAFTAKYITEKLPIDKDDWKLDADGKLTIKTSAAIKDYNKVEDVPWHAYRDLVTKVEYASTNLKGVGANMFSDMSELTSVDINNNGGAKIGDYAFYNCPKLVTMNYTMMGVTAIGDGAFGECTSLTYLYLDENLESIGSLAFAGCDAIKSMYADAATPPTVKSNTFQDFDQSKVLLEVSSSKQMAYIRADYWKKFQFKSSSLHGKITATDDFYDGYFILYEDGTMECYANDHTVNQNTTPDKTWPYRSKVTSVRVSGDISYLGRVFSGYTELTDAILDPSVTQLSQTFHGCTSLKSVTASGLTTLGINSFRDCSSLQYITLTNVESILDNCFEGSGLTSIKVPNLKTVSKEAFKNCTALSVVNIGNAEIKGTDVFKGCTALKSFTYNGHTVKEGMFAGCSNLDEVTFGSNVQSIEGKAFTGTSLSTIKYFRASPAELNYSDYDNIFSGIDAHDITLYVPEYCINQFKAAHTWTYMDIQGLTEGDDTFDPWFFTLPQTGFFADNNSRWTLSEDGALSVEADGDMSEWGSDVVPDRDNSVLQWMPYINTVYIFGETTHTMDNMFPSDNGSGYAGIERLFLGSDIESVGASFNKLRHLSDVYCYAETAPEIDANAFNWSDVLNNAVKLHVLNQSGVKESFKANTYWKKFTIKSDIGEVYTVTLEAMYGYILVQEEGINLNAVPVNTVLHLIAVPAAGYRFVRWENYNEQSGLKVGRDVTVTAVFELINTALEDVKAGIVSETTKIMVDGQLMIVAPDGRVYNLQGNRVK